MQKRPRVAPQLRHSLRPPFSVATTRRWWPTTWTRSSSCQSCVCSTPIKRVNDDAFDLTIIWLRVLRSQEEEAPLWSPLPPPSPAPYKPKSVPPPGISQKRKIQRGKNAKSGYQLPSPQQYLVTKELLTFNDLSVSIRQHL